MMNDPGYAGHIRLNWWMAVSEHPPARVWAGAFPGKMPWSWQKTWSGEVMPNYPKKKRSDRFYRMKVSRPVFLLLSIAKG